MSFICPVCKQTGSKEVEMEEVFDELKCPECKSSIFLLDKSPLPRYIHGWKTHAEQIEPLLRQPLNQSDLGIPRLYLLYEDCYHNLLIGRYNAAIVMMGVLLEALMKERVLLKMGKEMGYSYGTCLNVIKTHKLMAVDDRYFLEQFKDKIRDLYQHSKETEIVEGGFVRAWPIKLERKNSLLEIKKGLEDIKNGKIKSIMIPSGMPTVRSFVKQEHDRKIAIDLFNSVYDFLLSCNVRYFKKEEYEEAYKKFGHSLFLD